MDQNHHLLPPHPPWRGSPRPAPCLPSGQARGVRPGPRSPARPAERVAVPWDCSPSRLLSHPTRLRPPAVFFGFFCMEPKSIIRSLLVLLLLQDVRHGPERGRSGGASLTDMPWSAAASMAPGFSLCTELKHVNHAPLYSTKITSCLLRRRRDEMRPASSHSSTTGLRKQRPDACL